MPLHLENNEYQYLNAKFLKQKCIDLGLNPKSRLLKTELVELLQNNSAEARRSSSSQSFGAAEFKHR
jgi:hypothetical protein